MDLPPQIYSTSLQGNPPNHDGSEPEQLEPEIKLTLTIRDRETLDELGQHAAGKPREEAALHALRIGILAMRQARGQMDTEMIRRESERLLTELRGRFEEHSRTMHDRVATSLQEYFHPETGRFQQRVDALVKRDGELEAVLRRQLDGGDSSLARTLLQHVGQESPLFRLLNPEESQGLMSILRQTMDTAMRDQRDRVLREFSLDNKEGALSRLVCEITDSQGQFTEDMQKKLDGVLDEFSLDKEDSALRRLVKNVEEAQRTISNEFSLDNDGSAFSRLHHMLANTTQAIHGNLTLDDDQSPLSRLKKELLEIIKTHQHANHEFQEEVKLALTRMAALREEADRGTRHGLVFEDALCGLLDRHCQKTGDRFERTGNKTGLKQRCKVGDAVITLGEESAAPGARIVIEAKEHARYSLTQAAEEIAEARDNRNAQVGIFVFSKKTAAEGLDPLCRHGQDIFVVWDAEDGWWDTILYAGISLAKALCVRARRASETQTADVQAMTTAMLEIEKQAANLGEIATFCTTITKNSTRIMDRVDKSKASLERQIEVLRSKLEALRQEAS